MKVNIFDSHLHSDNSPDAVHSVAYLCEHAMQHRIMGFAVTDHFECHEKLEEQEQGIRQMSFEVERARGSFGSAIKLSKGIELGQPHNYPEAAKNILGCADFDFVLSSVHILEDGTDFYYIDYSNPSIVVSDLLEKYYENLFRLAKWNGFDSLAHIRYPERYIWGDQRIPVSIEPYMDYIVSIFKLLIQNGKALEVNTSAMKKGMSCDPGVELLKLYRELGGELITIGSDAHNAPHMAFGFDDTMDLLLTLGYRYFAFYSRRLPVMLRIL